MKWLSDQDIAALVAGRHTQPFALLGQHERDGESWILSFQPHAERVCVLHGAQQRLELERVHEHGLFGCSLDRPLGPYRLELGAGDQSWEIVDPYSLNSAIGELDRHLFNEGTHQQLYQLLGSHAVEVNGVAGVVFACWAPNALTVSVVGDFNQWDGRRHVMRAHPGSGIWDIFIPDISPGVLYKFEIRSRDGQLLPLKHDPYAGYFEQPPGNAAIVFSSEFVWSDQDWIKERAGRDILAEPMSVYEVHLGSWRRNLHMQPLNYRELVDTLLPYVKEHGFTHVELLPLHEHPFSGSWGYQPIGLYAPTSRFGSPDDFRYFVNAFHEAGIGVIIDWVPAHFPTDDHGLGLFDGTCLYEHADPRQGQHQDWGTLIYNYGRREVANYLLSNAVYWLREFHIDGLRVDAVASMLYLDYSREEGQWIPNQFGGNENLDAIDFLKRMNELVHSEGGFTVAEESTSFPGVSRPTYHNGLGFTLKWNMGWMHDTLDYFSKDPAYRKYHHNSLTFGMLYAFSENFVLPFSHDEVVHGKGSMINKMPGDDWQKFANLRALYGFMFAYPGKKLLFMGSEIGQYHEWEHDASIHWHLLEEDKHRGILRVIDDLNRLYREIPALHQLDHDHAGFEWVDCEDADQSVISFYRYGRDRNEAVLIICNFTPVVRHHYRIGVNKPGTWQEILNTDARWYGGSDVGNLGQVQSEPVAVHQREHSLSLTLPPLATMMFRLKLDSPAEH